MTIGRSVIMGIALALMAALVTSPAGAASVTVMPLGVSPGKIVEFSVNGGSSYNDGWAGVIHWTRTDGVTGGFPQVNFDTFCIEVTQHVQVNHSYTYSIVEVQDASVPVGTGIGHTKANLLRELYGRHFGSANTHDKAAAFQMAAWEIVHDTGLRLDLGAFRGRYGSQTPAYLTIAQQWLGTLDGTGPHGNLLALSSATAQDQIILTPAPVPLPAAAWSGLALLGAVILRRAIKRRRVA